MIVRMKKVSLLIDEADKKDAVDTLADYGVMHINITSEPSQGLVALREKKQLVLDAQRILESRSTEQEHTEEPLDIDTVIEMAGEITGLNENNMSLHEKISIVHQNLQYVNSFGNFDPDALRELNKKGLYFHLYYLENKIVNTIETEFVLLESDKKKSMICVINNSPDNPLADYDELEIPKKNAQAYKDEARRLEEQLNAIHGDLDEMSKYIDSFASVLEKQNSMELYESVLEEARGTETRLCYLTGYVPSDSLETIHQYAEKKQTGLVIDDPDPQDTVPTKLKQPKAAKIIQPVFNFMGITPGYREFDPSIIFLLAYLVFTAMIIGDAGYGIIIAVPSILLLLKSKPENRLAPLLFTCMGLGIIAWGVITGTWFGSTAAEHLPVLDRFVIEPIASSNEDSLKPIMFISFTIGLIHLSLAKIELFFRRLPSLKAVGQLGSLVLLIGLYFLICQLILAKVDFGFINSEGLIIPLIITGLGMIIVFGQQEGNFIQGILKGISGLFFTALDSIGSFSDIISYLRLFAVGLASVKVADTFNLIALDVIGTEPFFIIPASVIVLFIGHTLNLVMGMLSILVHGIRLNILEYSGQLGLEWSGYPYKPFARNNK